MKSTPSTSQAGSEIEGIGFDLEVARLAYMCCGAKSVSIDGYEADDLIASYSAQYDGKIMVFLWGQRPSSANRERSGLAGRQSPEPKRRPAS